MRKRAVRTGDASRTINIRADLTEVVLNLRTRTDNPHLFLSARSGSARACLTKETFENPQTPPSFCIKARRKHFTGGRLLDVRTLPDERILFFDFQCTNEMGDTVVNTMAAELMGRYSNLVLVQTKNPANPAAEGKIIDALKRVDFEDSEVRQLCRACLHAAAPSRRRRRFWASARRHRGGGVAERTARSGGTHQDNGRRLVVCREAAYRAFGGRDVTASRMTEQEKAALLEAVAFVQAAYADGGTPVAVVVDGRPVEFSFLPLTQYSGADLVEYGSYSNCWRATTQPRTSGAPAPEEPRFGKDRAQSARACRAQSRRPPGGTGAECGLGGTARLRRASECQSGAIQRRENADADEYYDGKGSDDPAGCAPFAQRQCSEVFKEYKKKQTAARMLTELIAESDAEAEYLATVQYEVETAEGEAALAEIRAELKSQGYLKYYKAKDKKQKPADFLRYVSSDGFPILVGRNNAQNDRLTLKTARGRDVWFHVKNAPGSHAVVLSGGQPVPDTTKTEAAVLAAVHSSQNGGAKVQVDYTEVRNVWKANGAKPGMVLYDPYETAVVTPDPALAERLRAK